MFLYGVMQRRGFSPFLQSKLNKFDIVINLADGPSLGVWVEESVSVFLSLSNLKQKISAEPAPWQNKDTR